MANFDLFFPKLMGFEGGYVNDPEDHGGATKWGVTLQEWILNGYDKNGDGKIDAEDIKLLTQADAIKIAKPLYWNQVKGDAINNQSIAEFLCDFAYNSGTGTAIRKLQKVLGVTIDGIIGNETLSSLNSGDQEKIFTAFKQSRIDFVNAIVKNNPTQVKFLKGWLIRINSFLFRSAMLAGFILLFTSCSSTIKQGKYSEIKMGHASKDYKEFTRGYVGYGTFRR